MSWTEYTLFIYGTYLSMDTIEKKYYKISEVAALLGLPASTLRFWESRFTIIHPKRNAGGLRLYTPSDIEKIRMIHFLVKEKGLKLDAAQEQLRNNTSGITRRYETVARLRDIRAKLTGMLDAIDKLR